MEITDYSTVNFNERTVGSVIIQQYILQYHCIQRLTFT